MSRLDGARIFLIFKLFWVELVLSRVDDIVANEDVRKCSAILHFSCTRYNPGHVPFFSFLELLTFEISKLEIVKLRVLSVH